MTDKEVQFPFNTKFQSGLLHLLITDFGFFKNIIEDISPKYFDNESHVKLFKVISNIWKLTKQELTLNIVENTIENLHFSDGDLFGIKNVLDAGKNLVPSEYEYIRTNAIEFIRRQNMAVAFSSAIEDFEQNDFDAVYKKIGEAYKKSFGIGVSVGLDYANSSVLDRYKEPPRKDIWPSPWPDFNKFIGGGFAKRECVNVVSPTGRGKTAWLCNLTIQAMKEQQKVVFYTLEMPELVIAQRCDAILSGFSPDEISKNPDVQVFLQNEMNRFKRYKPTIKEFNRGQLSIQGLRTALDRHILEIGYPDVVIVDWLGCMKLPSWTDKKHEALAEVADELVNISREYNCCLITSQQTNRTAAGNDLFGYSSVSESFSALFGMDIVLGLGASDKAKDSGKRTLNILKSRVGPDSVHVNLQGNRASEAITFKFVEVPSEEEEAELLSPEE